MTAPNVRGRVVLAVASLGFFACGGDGPAATDDPGGVDQPRPEGDALDGGSGNPGRSSDAASGGTAGGSRDAPPHLDVAAQPEVRPAPAVPPDIDGRVVINEIMASNGLTLKNEAGLAGD